MSPAIEGTERADRFTSFLRRLAEWQAYSLSGDRHAFQVWNAYGSLTWAGHRPQDALQIAELEVGAANRETER